MNTDDIAIGDEATEIEIRRWRVVGIEKDPLGLSARDVCIVEDPNGNRETRPRLLLLKKRSRPLAHISAA